MQGGESGTMRIGELGGVGAGGGVAEGAGEER